MSSRVESARQLHGKTVHFEAFECVAAKSSKLQSGERHRWRCAYQDRIISASNNNPTSFCGLPPPPTIIWKNLRWSFETWTRTIIWILDNGTHDIWNWRSHRMSTSISLYLELFLLVQLSAGSFVYLSLPALHPLLSNLRCLEADDAKANKTKANQNRHRIQSWLKMPIFTCLKMALRVTSKILRPLW